MEPPSKRISHRHDVGLPIIIEKNGEKYEGKITNMSVGGLYVEVDNFMVSPREVLKVKFSIPILDNPIEVDVNIRWVNKIGDKVSGFGAQFLGLTAKEVWGLTKYFSSLQKIDEE